MSAPFGTGQFDDAEYNGIERRIQDELRRSHQATAVSRLASSQALGFTRQPANDSSAFTSALGASETSASPYYQRQAHASPYARSYLPSPDLVAAHMYSRRAFANNYSGPNADLVHAAAASAYSVPSANRDFSPQYFGRSAQEVSLMEHTYNVQRNQEQNAALLSAAKTPAAVAPAASTGNLIQKTTPRISPQSVSKVSSSPRATSASKPMRSVPRTSSTPKVARADEAGGQIGGANRLMKPSTIKATLLETGSTLLKTCGSGSDDESQKWFSGCVPLGLDDDKYWLSELQVYLRANFAEAFGATEEDIAAPMHGRNKPIALGQVGIRCMHCKHDSPTERGQQSTSYPSLISGIYNSVQQMLRLHLDCCQAMPAEVRQKIEQLKLSSSSRGGRKQYWIDSAKRLGLVDTPHGIHFGRDPLGPLPPLTGPSVNSREGRKKKAEKQPSPDEEVPKSAPDDPKPVPLVDARPLVFPEDKPLISDYLFLTLEQMAPCVLMEADRVGCYKTRKVGFPGLACKHCVGQAGCGRYFPASEASLSQTTTSQTIMNHVRNCRRCPIEIRENLEIMKRARMGPDGKRADKPKHGGRKVFFHRLWCRIQGLPIEAEKGETKEKKRGKNPKPSQKKVGKKRQDSSPKSSDAEDSAEDDKADAETTGDASASSGDETETEDESSGGEGSEDELGVSIPAVSKTKTKTKASSPSPRQNSWYDGCVRLSKTDDPHWLTEMECFVRSDLVELFTLKKKDSLEGYGGRKEPSIGQVGVRCIFCKSLEPSERPTGYMAFPESLSSIYSKVGDMIRLHFPSCFAMPEESRETFKSLRGFGAKAVNDSQQYWVDAARDIGLAETPPDGPGSGWGLSFRRDPLHPSPSDELDRENVGATTVSLGKSSLVRADDRGLCTDQVMLLLRQVKPCRFKKSDRRAGPSARGRDRVIGFPGLCCKHCVAKSNMGRYFPVSAKNLTDNTANSLLAHVASCSRCPEPVRASLTFLSHRSVLQKAELSGSWKKTFFKRVWDRLHIERAWDKADEEVGKECDDVSSPPCEGKSTEDEPKDTGGFVGSDTEDEDLGDHMNSLIKAAAVWLTEQDAATDSVSRSRANRGRALPGSKRSLPFSPQKGKGKGTNLSSKRRRAHF